VLINRLRLRNFRVYEDELDLDVPPGLVGIFGPNGAGKSTLLEAIVFALWGRARTPKELIRSTGVGGEGRAEISFEHEGHLYEVTRTLSGINSTVKAEARADGMVMASGVRDVGRYVHSVLGMDDAAFRASVFAEQKQLAAFSSQAPADRRKLVLQLLGITPLDQARDRARKDARDALDQHQRVRAVLPDLEVLQVAAADADARAAAAEAMAAEQEAAHEVLRDRAEAAAAALATVEQGRTEYETLVGEGRAARQELDRLTAELTALSGEEEQLAAAAARLADADARAAHMDRDEALTTALRPLVELTRTLDRLPEGAEPPVADPGPRDAALAAAQSARDELAAVAARVESAEQDLHRARQAAERSGDLSGEGDCPLCGQELGDAFAAVQAHRRAEVAEAEDRLASLTVQRGAAASRAREAAGRLEVAERALRQAESARSAWEVAAGRRAEVQDAVAQAAKAVEVLADEVPVSLPERVAALETAESALRAGRAAAAEAAGLRGRLERRPVVTARVVAATAEREAAIDRVEGLRRRVRDLGYEPARVQAAQTAHAEAERRRVEADRAGRAARLAATQERTRAEGDVRRLEDAREQHASIAALETDARHLRRLADLLGDFRNTVVASVGPRLAHQAAQLFGELTDHEYDELLVDPETFELQISDGGRTFGLDRFSGSEVDLANLALRVAISEHIRFQSGGSVGLLVLDEVFGPLDDERKVRMLQALQHLGSRFRQVLVVTHDNEIKEQLPHAIEVVKQPGRRATARLAGV
jgi:exonuclease SbcC